MGVGGDAGHHPVEEFVAAEDLDAHVRDIRHLVLDDAPPRAPGASAPEALALADAQPGQARDVPQPHGDRGELVRLDERDHLFHDAASVSVDCFLFSSHS